MKKILCFLICAALIFSFASCGKGNKKDTESGKKENTSQTDTTQPYEPEWVLQPSFKADKIFPLPLTVFNTSTNHYDVSFGEMYAFETEGKVGFVDSNGQIIIEPKYDSAETCLCTEKYILTSSSSGYTISYRLSPSDLTAVWGKTHKCSGENGYRYLWDADSQKVKAVYLTSGYSQNSVKKAFLPEVCEVVQNGENTGKFVVVNAGEEVGASDYTGAGIFTDGLAAVEKNGKWGYVNSKGEKVIDFDYDAVEGYSAVHDGDHSTPYESSEGYVTVLKGGKYGIIKSNGKQVVPCMFSYLTTVHNGRAFASQNGKDWGILCVDGKISEGIAPSKSAQTTTSSSQSEYSSYNKTSTTSSSSYSYTSSTNSSGTSSGEYTSTSSNLYE